MIRETQVEIGRRRLRYLEAGAGWPVILLHAFPLNADMWRPQLEHAPRGWRMIAPDLRGFSAPPPGAPLVTPSVTMDDYAADVDALLDHLEIESAAIGGLSMGGYVTFALHRLSPQRFTAMILADTRPQSDTPEGRDGRRQMIELVHREGLGAVADRMLPKLLGATTLRERPEIAAQARAVIEMVPA
jgi:3-oxoadipate enol-lactonase